MENRPWEDFKMDISYIFVESGMSYAYFIKDIEFFSLFAFLLQYWKINIVNLVKIQQIRYGWK